LALHQQAADELRRNMHGGAGDKGDQIVSTDTPEEMAVHPTSHTERYLKQVLKQLPF